MCDQAADVPADRRVVEADSGSEADISTSAEDVVWMLDVMDGCGANPIVAGGWGVDALAGEQTREHRDLDVLVRSDALGALLDAFLAAGFEVTEDWLPVRIELSDTARERHVDLHPIHMLQNGDWWQHLPEGQSLDSQASHATVGRIGETAVRGLTAARQQELHTGYTHRSQDRHDLDVLHRISLRPTRSPAPDVGGSVAHRDTQSRGAGVRPRRYLAVEEPDMRRRDETQP